MEKLGANDPNYWISLNWERAMARLYDLGCMDTWVAICHMLRKEKGRFYTPFSSNWYAFEVRCGHYRIWRIS